MLPTQQKTDQGETRPPETRRGDPDRALADAEVKVDHTYVIPRENHNPIEMHATIAAWDGDRLTLWDKTQWVNNTAAEIAAVFGIAAENIRVVSPFVGGAFGSGLRTWPHVTLAALGARVAGPASQGDAVAARDVLRRWLPPAHCPARRARRIARRPSRSHCA